MLFLLSCSISATPQSNQLIQEDMQSLNHHLQSIELLSNQLLEAEKKQDTKTIIQLQNQLEEENNAVQLQKKQLMEHLRIEQEPSKSVLHEP